MTTRVEEHKKWKRLLDEAGEDFDRCQACGKAFLAGDPVYKYYDELYCSEPCLHKHVSPEEWAEKSADFEDPDCEVYWTEHGGYEWAL